jgi:ABC-2 type transport system permease protein
MSRVLAIATAEFLALIRTKFFLVGVILLPVMIGASVAFQAYAKQHVDVEDHRFGVLDHAGGFFAALAHDAEEHNRQAGVGKDRTDSHFIPVETDLGGRSAEPVKLELSAQVKSRQLFAFIEIPADIAALAVDTSAKSPTIDYFTETPSYQDLPDWLEKTLNREIARKRFAAAAVDPNLVDTLSTSTTLSTLGLLERANDGTVRPARKVRDWQTFAVPFALMYLLMLAVMLNAPHMMNAVIEEKMSRISEVLIASVSPFQLLAGKLAGIAAVSVLLALVYLGAGIYAAFMAGAWDLIQASLIGWFIVFLLCAVLIFGSVFLSIGAACADLKDAQSMLQPAMFMLLMPLFASAIVLRAPNSDISIVLSLIPIATPFLMLVRLAMTPPPPFWQVALSVILTVSTAAGFVWAAGRVFRVGLLMQGKPPNLPELLRWIRR